MKENFKNYPFYTALIYHNYVFAPFCYWQRSEKTLESAVCGFKGFLASLERRLRSNG